MRQVFREELQQILNEEPKHFDCFTRRFRDRRNFNCFGCSRSGHTQRHCTANTNPQRHYVSHSKGTGQPIRGHENCCCNTNQGNGLALLSL